MGRSGGGVGRAEAIQKTGLQPCPACAGPLALSSRQISNPALLYAANHLQMMGCLSPAGFCSRANSNTGAAPCLSSTSRCRESGLYLASDMIWHFHICRVVYIHGRFSAIDSLPHTIPGERFFGECVCRSSCRAHSGNSRRQLPSV